MTAKVVFPSFRGEDYPPYEMRQLVSAIELRFSSLESNQDVSIGGSGSTGDTDLETLIGLFSQIGHDHTASEISDLEDFLGDLDTGVTSLFDLTDVGGSPEHQDILIYDGTQFVPQGASSLNLRLDDLLDVQLFVPEEGHVIQYDEEDIFKNVLLELDALFDFTTTNAQQFDLIYKASSQEENAWRPTAGLLRWNPGNADQGLAGVFGLNADSTINWFDLDEETDFTMLQFAVTEIGGDDDFSNVQNLTQVTGSDGGTTYVELSLNAFNATFVNNAQIDTANVLPWGTSSFLFNKSTDDYIHYPDDDNLHIGSNVFTIEAWIYLASLPAIGEEYTIVSQWAIAGSADESFALTFLQDGGNYRIRFEADGVFEQGTPSPNPPLINTWYHVAAQRSANDNLTIWFNGSKRFEANVFFGPIQNSTETVKIGVYDPAGSVGTQGFFDGNIDGVRITIGSERYDGTTVLTPPTAAFPVAGNEETSFRVGNIDPGFLTIIQGVPIRFDGDVQFNTDIISDVNIVDGKKLCWWDSTNADNACFTHTGVDFQSVFINTLDWDLAGLTGNLWIRDGAGLKISDSTDTDDLTMSHDGTDFNSVFTTTADWQITGLAGGNMQIDGSLIVDEDLTVSGTTTTLNTNIVSIADNIILLNSDETGSPTEDAGFEVERGTSANVQFLWDEDTDTWQVLDPFRVWDSGGTDYIEISHDGTDAFFNSFQTSGFVFTGGSGGEFIFTEGRLQLSAVSSASAISGFGTVHVDSLGIHEGLRYTGSSGVEYTATNAFHVAYIFETSTVASDPGQSDMRFNNATLANVTAFYFDINSALNEDTQWWFDTLTEGDLIEHQGESDPNLWHTFRITGAPTDNTGWWTVPVVFVQGSGTLPADGDVIHFRRLPVTGTAFGDLSDVDLSGAADHDLLFNNAGTWEDTAGFLTWNDTTGIMFTEGTAPAIRFNDSNSAPGSQSSIILNSGSRLSFLFASDDFSTSQYALEVTRVTNNVLDWKFNTGAQGAKFMDNTDTDGVAFRHNSGEFFITGDAGVTPTTDISVSDFTGDFRIELVGDGTNSFVVSDANETDQLLITIDGNDLIYNHGSIASVTWQGTNVYQFSTAISIGQGNPPGSTAGYGKVSAGAATTGETYPQWTSDTDHRVVSMSSGVTEWHYDNNTSAADPGQTRVRFNSTNPAAISAMYIDDESMSESEPHYVLQEFAVGNILTVHEVMDPTMYVILQVTGAATDNTGWWTVPVTEVGANSNMVTDNKLVKIHVEHASLFGSAIAFDDLSDVDLTGAADNDLLFRSGGNWIDSAGALTWDTDALRTVSSTALDAPGIIFENTAAAVDEGKWRLTLDNSGATLNLDLLDDAETGTTQVFTFTRSVMALGSLNWNIFTEFVGGARLPDDTGLNIGSGSDTTFTWDTSRTPDALTVGGATDGIFAFIGQRDVRFEGASDTNYVSFHHDDTDLNITSAGTGQVNITGTAPWVFEDPIYIGQIGGASAIAGYAGLLTDSFGTVGGLRIEYESNFQGHLANTHDVIFQFDVSTTASDPGQSDMRYDNATVASVTNLYYDQNQATSEAAAFWLAALSDGDTIDIVGEVDTSLLAVFTVNGTPTDNTGWWTVPVLHVYGTTLPSAGDILISRRTATGAVGSVTAFDDLSDVDLTSAADNDLLVRDGGNWIDSGAKLTWDNTTGEFRVYDTASGEYIFLHHDGTDAILATQGAGGSTYMRFDGQNLSTAFLFDGGIPIRIAQEQGAPLDYIDMVTTSSEFQMSATSLSGAVVSGLAQYFEFSSPIYTTASSGTARTNRIAWHGEAAGNDLAPRATSAADVKYCLSAVQELLWGFDTDITATDPGSGDIKFNSATPASVTAIYVSDIIHIGGQFGNWMVDNLADGDILTIIAEADEADYLVASVNGTPTDNTGWWTIPVTVIHSGTLPAADDMMKVTVEWASQHGASLAFDDLSDVDLTGAATNDMLVFDGSDWIDTAAKMTWNPSTHELRLVGDATQEEPITILECTVAAADEAIWSYHLENSGASLVWDIRNDAEDTFVNIFKIDRAGMVLGTMTYSPSVEYETALLIGDEVQFLIGNTSDIDLHWDTVRTTDQLVFDPFNFDTIISFEQRMKLQIEGNSEGTHMALWHDDTDFNIETLDTGVVNVIGGDDWLFSGRIYVDEFSGVSAQAGMVGISADSLGNGLRCGYANGQQQFLGNPLEVIYQFDPLTSGVDPGTSDMRYSSATMTSVTNLYYDSISSLGQDGEWWLAGLRLGDFIHINCEDDPTRNAIFRIDGTPTDNTGWWTVPVKHVYGTQLPTGGEVLASRQIPVTVDYQWLPTQSASDLDRAGFSQFFALSNGFNAATPWWTNDTGDEISMSTLHEFPYRFDALTAAADPGNGNMRFDSATPASVTNLYFDDTQIQAWNNNWFQHLVDGDVISIINEFDRNDYLVCSVNGTPTDNTGWWTVPVTVIHSGTLPAEDDLLKLKITWMSQAGAATSLGSLSDVDLTGAADNDLLYRTGGNWEDTAGALTWDGTILQMTASLPNLRIAHDAGGVDDSNWMLRGSTAQLELFAMDDTFSGATSVIEFNRSGTLVTNTRINTGSQGVYFLDDGFSDAVSFLHDGTDFLVVADALGATNDFLLSGLDGNFWIQDGAGLKISNSGDVDFLIMTHDGADFNLDFTGTTFVNITGATGGWNFSGPVYVPISGGISGKANFGGLFAEGGSTDGGPRYMSEGSTELALSNIHELIWRFDTTTTSADPGAGDIRFNSATPASVTNLFVSDTQMTTPDAHWWLSNLNDGDILLITGETDQADFLFCTVNGAPTDNTDWWTIPVTMIDSGTLPTSNDSIKISAQHASQHGAAIAFNDLSDVDLTGAADNDLLFRSGGNWIDSAGLLTWDGGDFIYHPVADHGWEFSNDGADNSSITPFIAGDIVSTTDSISYDGDGQLWNITGDIDFAPGQGNSIQTTGTTTFSLRAGSTANGAAFRLSEGSDHPSSPTSGSLWFTDGALYVAGDGGDVALNQVTPSITQYSFQTSTNTAIDPGAHTFSMNSATPASVTEIAVDDLMADGQDFGTYWAAELAVGDFIILQQWDDNAKYIILEVSSTLTDGTGFWRIPVSVVDSGTLFDGFVGVKMEIRLAAHEPINALDDLTDVDLTGVATGDMLYKSAGDWLDTAGLFTWDGSKVEITDGATWTTDGLHLDLNNQAGFLGDDFGILIHAGGGRDIAYWDDTGLVGQHQADTVYLVMDSAASPTTPCYTFRGDNASGVSQENTDNNVLTIAGSVEGTRWTQASSSILQRHEANVGLTADVGSAQGNGVILSSYNEYSTVGTAGDAATLPAAFGVGEVVYAKNNGANSMDIFPASGDDLGEGLNTAYALQQGAGLAFIGTAASASWEQLIPDHTRVFLGADFRIYDSTDTDFLSISHDGTDINFAATTTTGVQWSGTTDFFIDVSDRWLILEGSTAKFEVDHSDNLVWAHDGYGLKLSDTDDTDFVIMSQATAGGDFSFVGTNSAKYTFDAEVTSQGSYLLEGYTVQRNILRAERLTIEPGATPGTNINITPTTVDAQAFNNEGLTGSTNLAKSGTSGSFSLNAAGTQISTTNNNVIGPVSCSITIHDINSSSTTEMYTVDCSVTSADILIQIYLRGSISAVDWTTIMDAGDRIDILYSYVTNT